jgi:hypothetical protein
MNYIIVNENNLTLAQADQAGEAARIAKRLADLHRERMKIYEIFDEWAPSLLHCPSCGQEIPPGNEQKYDNIRICCPRCWTRYGINLPRSLDLDITPGQEIHPYAPDWIDPADLQLPAWLDSLAEEAEDK